MAFSEESFEERRRGSVEESADPRRFKTASLGGSSTSDQRNGRRCLEERIKLSSAKFGRGKAKQSDPPGATLKLFYTFL